MMPLSAVTVILLFGLTRRDRARGRRWILTAALLLYIASCPPMAWLVLHPLEKDAVGYLPAEELPTPEAIAVLGAGYHPVAGRPLTGVLSSMAVTRVAEAVRITRIHPDARLHCSGWGGRWEGSSAEAACELAAQLGVKRERLVEHVSARDTREEALAVAASGAKRVIVVTHAAHMPRALLAFRQAGVHPIAAPTGHVSPSSPSWSLWPSVEALGTTTGALHEWLGRLWFMISS